MRALADPNFEQRLARRRAEEAVAFEEMKEQIRRERKAPAEPAPAAGAAHSGKVENDDIAAIRLMHPRADTETRAWWADRMKVIRHHPGHPKNIEKQLKKLGIPPRPTQ